MAIGTDDGQQFENGFEHRVQLAQTDTQRLYVSPNKPKEEGAGEPVKSIEDRRNENPLLGTLKGLGTAFGAGVDDLIKRSLGMNTALSADNPQPDINNPMSKDLGVQDISATMPLGATEKPAGALKSMGGSQTPDNSQISKLPDIEDVPHHDWVEGLVKSAIDAFKLPGDVYQGKVDPLSEQGLERSTNLAGFMVGGPSPVVTADKDVLGSFAGLKSIQNLKGAAKAEALSNLGHAQVLEAAGEHPDVIHEKTGFHRGAEGKWKYEINDSKASFDREWFKDQEPEKYPETKDPFEQVPFNPNVGFVTKPLSEILDHPDLYRAYPFMKDMKVRFDPGEDTAYYDPDAKSITLGPKSASDQGTLMHEIQHAIQDHEDFAKGGVPGQAGKDYKLRLDNLAREKIEKPLRRIVQLKESGVVFTPEMQAEADRLIGLAKKYQEYSKAGHKQVLSNYFRLAGEVEARNVDSRLYMTERERRILSPLATEEPQFPREKQIVSDQTVLTTPYGIKTSQLGPTKPVPPMQIKYPRIPRNAEEELEQLMENRRTNKLMGYDTNSPDYKYYNDRINELQNKVKNKSVVAKSEKPKSKGYEALETARQKAVQQYIKANLPKVKSFEDKIWDNYAKKMSPEELWHSETIWGGARRLAEESGWNEHEAFAYLMNQMLRRKGLNGYVSSEMASKFMADERLKQVLKK